jgi:hypothetical protein
MDLIVRVTSPPDPPWLSPLLETPLGLDVWEVKPDHVVAQASEAVARPGTDWSPPDGPLDQSPLPPIPQH